MSSFDVCVIGGGPAGLAAALEADRNGAKTLIIEREAALGGILKQCIHDGFGLVRFGEAMTGPEYADRFIREVKKTGIEISLLTFITRIKKENGAFILSAVTEEGVKTFTARSIVFATGCRERTGKQIGVHGTRPSGVFTAGTAQYYTNIRGLMPAKKCVILGSGDIGLIMARRLTLEGARVIGVYEVMDHPSGLKRNIAQCLNDFDIPLHLSHTVTRVFGEERLTAVEISEVDSELRPVPGTEQIIECDALILSVGLIPENELISSLGVEIDPKTRGPVTDEKLETTEKGVFCCGNSLHVFDLVDYVSDSGETAGRAAAEYALKA